MTNDIQTAKDTLKIEIEGMTQLMDSIDAHFETAVQTIQTMKDAGKLRPISYIRVRLRMVIWA